MHAMIVALGNDWAIGQRGQLPWRGLTGDLRWFSAITRARHPLSVAQGIVDGREVVSSQAYNALIYGRRTYESVGPRAFPGRFSWVVTSRPTAIPDDAYTSPVRTLRDALHGATVAIQSPNVFVCGGTRLYADALLLPEFTHIFLTQVDADFPQADTWFPRPGHGWDTTAQGPWLAEHGLRYRLTILERAAGGTA
jgi:dihydrofolate reductase